MYYTLNAFTDFEIGIRNIDDGQVPNGARCGRGKMCVNSKCTEIILARSCILCNTTCDQNGKCMFSGKVSFFSLILPKVEKRNCLIYLNDFKFLQILFLMSEIFCGLT